MYVKEVTVENQVGLHARPATFCLWASWAAPPSASSLTALMSRLQWTV